jgi:hypothetical protein
VQKGIWVAKLATQQRAPHNSVNPYSYHNNYKHGNWEMHASESNARRKTTAFPAARHGSDPSAVRTVCDERSRNDETVNNSKSGRCNKTYNSWDPRRTRRSRWTRARRRGPGSPAAAPASTRRTSSPWTAWGSQKAQVHTRRIDQLRTKGKKRRTQRSRRRGAAG